MRMTRKRRKARDRQQRAEKNVKNVLSKSAYLAVAGIIAMQSGDIGQVYAMPQGGQVAAGQAGIHQAGQTMTIAQQTAQAIINWRSFGIMPNEHVHFLQPGANAVMLNRVLGNDPSAIYGKLTANGRVFLVNPNGVFFAPGAQVNVGGLVATTLSITDADFMNGRYRFNNDGTAGSVVNQGTITAQEQGLVALLAPEVKNEGIIAAKKGTVALAAGDAMTLDYAGDGKIQLAVAEGAFKAAVENKGLVEADGGIVLMTARGNQDVTSSVVNQSGIIHARSLDGSTGEVTLDAGPGSVRVAGNIDVIGTNDHRGGTFNAYGKDIALTGTAAIDASGEAGGGMVRIGGDWQGKGGAPHADNVTMEKGAAIHADAMKNGDGGKVVLWSDGTTKFAGTITAKGGAAGGDGGMVETSGHVLKVGDVTVDAGAAKGKGGEWLLDPYNMEIVAGTGGSFTAAQDNSMVGADTITGALNTGTSVTLQTGTGGTQAGNITVSAAINKTAGGDATLKLDAEGSITVNADITSTVGKLNVDLDAAKSTTGGQITVNAGKKIITNGGDVTLHSSGATANDFVTSSSASHAISVAGSIASGGGNIVLKGSNSNAGSGVLVGGELNSGGGNIELSGMSANGSGIKTTGAVDSGAGNVTLTGDSMSLGGTIKGTGDAIIKRLTAGDISIGANAGTGLALKNFSALKDFGSIQIGDASLTNKITVDGEASLAADTTLQSKGDIAINGALIAAGKKVTLNAAGKGGGAGIVTAGQLDLQGGEYALTGANKVAVLTGSAKKVQFTNAGDLAVGTAGGGLTVQGASALTSTNGKITVQNAITAGAKADITLQAENDVSVEGDVMSSGGNIVLTSQSGAIGLASGKTINSGAGNLTLKGQSLALTGGTVQGMGTLTIDHSAKNGTIGIGAASTGTLKINPASFGATGVFKPGFGEVVIGGKDTGNIDVADALTVDGKLTVNSNGTVLFASGSLKTSGNQNLTLNSGVVSFGNGGALSAGTGTLTLNTDAITNWAQADFGGSDGGSLVIAPKTANKALFIGGSDEDKQLAVTAVGLGQIAGGKFADVTIGKSGSMGAVSLDSITQSAANLTVYGGKGTINSGAVITNQAGEKWELHLSALTQDAASMLNIGGELALLGNGDFSLKSNTNQVNALTASDIKDLQFFGTSLGVGNSGIAASGNIDWKIDNFTSILGSGTVTAGGDFTLQKLGGGDIYIGASGAGSGDLSMSAADIAKVTANGTNGITIGGKEYTGVINVGTAGMDTKFTSLLNLLTKQTVGSAVNLAGNVYAGTAAPYKNLTIYTWEMSWPGNLYVHDLTLDIGKGLVSNTASNVHGMGALNVKMPEGMDIYISDTAPASGYQISYNILKNMIGFEKLTVAGNQNVYIDSGTFNQSVDISSGEGAGYGVTISGLVEIADKAEAKEMKITGNTITLESGAGIKASGNADVKLQADRLIDNASSHGNITGNGGHLTIEQKNAGTALTVGSGSNGLVVSKAQLDGDQSGYWLGKGFADMTLGRGDSTADAAVSGGVTLRNNATIQTGSGKTLNITGGGLTAAGDLTLKGGTIANNGNVIDVTNGATQFYANKLSLTGSNTVKGTGALGIGAYGEAISLGNTDHGGLWLTDAFLKSNTFKGFGPYKIGAAGQKIFVDGSSLDKDLTLLAKDIDFKGNLTLNDGTANKSLTIDASGYVGQTDGSLDDKTDAPQTANSAIVAGNVELKGGTYNLNSTSNKISGKLSADAIRVNVASKELEVGAINGNGGAIILSADRMTFAPDASLSSVNKTAGEPGGLLTLQQLTSGQAMQIGGTVDPGAGSLYLSETLFNGNIIKDGFDHGVYLGRLDLAGKVTVTGDLKFVDATYIRSAGAGGSVDVEPATITTNNNAITFQTDKLTTAGTNTKIQAGTGDITLSANEMELKDGTVIEGAGNLTLETWSKEWDEWIYLGGSGPGPGGKGLWLKKTYFELGSKNIFADGFKQIIIGNENAKGTLEQSGSIGFLDDVVIKQGSSQPGGGGYVAKGTKINTNNQNFSVESQNVKFDNVKVDAGTGDISIKTDNLTLLNGTRFTGDELILDTYSPGTQINVGGNSGLALDTEWFKDSGAFGGVGSIQLGSAANTGGIHLQGTLDTNKKLSMTTGGNVTSDANAVVKVNGTDLDIKGKDIHITGTLTGVGTLTATAADGGVRLTNGNNTIVNLGAIKGQGVTIKEKDGVTVTGTVESTGSGKDVAITVGEGALTIGSGGTVKAEHDVYLTATDKNGGKFINQSGADAIAAGNRWVAYTYDSLNDDYGGLTGDFRKYGVNSLGDLTGDLFQGSGSAHVHRPTATITAEKEYGSANGQFFKDKFKLTIDDADGGTNRQSKDEAFLAGTEFIKNTVYSSKKDANSYTFGSYIQTDGYDGEAINVNKNIGGTGQNGTAYGTAYKASDPSKNITYLESSNLLNYDVNVEFWVTPKKVTVSADNAAMDYTGGNNYTGGGGLQYNGFTNGQDVTSAGVSGFDNLTTSITKGGMAYNDVLNAGQYGLTINGGLYADNYVFDYKAGNLTVNKKKVTVTANDDSKTYDGQHYGGNNGVSYDGFVTGEGVEKIIGGTLQYGGSAQNAVNAGAYDVGLNGNLTADNYDFIYKDGNLTIKKKEITIGANNDTADYSQLGSNGYQGNVSNPNGTLNGTFGNGWGNPDGLISGQTIVWDAAQGKFVVTGVDGFSGSVNGYTGNSQGALAPGKYSLGLIGDLKSDNYIFTYMPGYLTITDINGIYVPPSPLPPNPNPNPPSPVPPNPNPNPPNPVPPSPNPNPPIPDQPSPIPPNPNPTPPSPNPPDPMIPNGLVMDTVKTVNAIANPRFARAAFSRQAVFGNVPQLALPPLMGDLEPNVLPLNREGVVNIVDVFATADFPKGDLGMHVQGKSVSAELYADRSGFGMLLSGIEGDYSPLSSRTNGAIPVLYTDYSSIGTDKEQTLDGFYDVMYTPERLSIEPKEQGETVPRRSEIKPEVRQDYAVAYKDAKLGDFRVAFGNGILTVHPQNDKAIDTVANAQKPAQRAVLTAGVLRAIQDFGVAPDQLRAIYIFREKKIMNAQARKG